MRVLKRNPWLAGLGALLVCLVASPPKAQADATINHGSSIVIFPKVIADGTRDTLIQIGNISNGTVFAHCFYVDASPANPFEPAGPTNPRLWVETNFDIALTRQQPTIWRVSTGRIQNIQAALGSCNDVTVVNVARQECPGFQPGNDPNTGTFFEGELKCIQVDASGAPVSGNALKGEAIIEDLEVASNGNISAYNAIGITGLQVQSDPALNLDNIEYNACPESVTIHHLAENAPDPVLGEEFRASTEVTVIPCTENFLTQETTNVTLQFLSYDEFESPTSTTTQLDCWLNDTFETIDGAFSNFSYASGSTVRRTTVRGSAASNSGILAVAETFRVSENGAGVRMGASAANTTVTGSRTLDVITLPAGSCQNNADPGSSSNAPCFDDTQCTPPEVCN
jgi:hypothetical protein